MINNPYEPPPSNVDQREVPTQSEQPTDSTDSTNAGLDVSIVFLMAAIATGGYGMYGWTQNVMYWRSLNLRGGASGTASIGFALLVVFVAPILLLISFKLGVLRVFSLQRRR